MKVFFAILLLMIGVCVACASRSTSQQTPQNSPAPVATATQTAAVVSDKGPCTLVMDQAPVLSGLRLGMTPEEVLALFPGSSGDAEVSSALAQPPSKFGDAEFLIRPDKYESKEKFAGVTQIAFSVLDGRVSSFRIGYNGPAWPDVDSFIAKFVEGTNLPAADGWEAYVGMDTQLKTLTCKNFETRIFAGGKGGNLNYVDMHDSIADKKLKQRMDKAEKEATP